MYTFLARQPIFDRRQEVYAYEVFYRSGMVNRAGNIIKQDEATSKVIIDTFQNFGIKKLTGGKPAFINFTENLIRDEVATLFSKKLLVVEILEHVRPDSQIVEKCIRLKEKGYKIALDDFVYEEEYRPLMDIADFVKVDFLDMEKHEIVEIVNIFKDTNVQLLAEKVETLEEFEYAKKLGFTLFQGFFFSKPEILSAKSLSPLKISYMKLVEKVNRDEMDFSELVDVIRRDLSLNYNILRLANSPYFGFRNEIRSVRHALVAIGEKEIKKWVILMALKGMGNNQPEEIVRQSLVRARFAELIAQKTVFKALKEELFMAGLFSMLDVLLNRPIIEILYEMRLSDDIKDLLLKDRGPLVHIYRFIIAYERGQWEKTAMQMKTLGIRQKDAVESYIEAVLWCDGIMDEC